MIECDVLNGVALMRPAGRVTPVRVGVRQKFVAAVGVLVVAVLVVSAVAIIGLASMAAKAGSLYAKDVATAEHSADLVAATLTVHESALYELATVDSQT